MTGKKLRDRPQEFSVTVTYLGMETRPHLPPPTPLLQCAILRCENPPVHFYRYLYDAVGRDYFWIERRLLSDSALTALLSDPHVALYLLYIAGVPAGMAELDFREAGIGQISYFGLTPEFIGRRIGPWFLHQAVELAWSQPIKRLLVNTCSLDHRRALATYQRAGFVAYARSAREIVVPANFPKPR